MSESKILSMVDVLGSQKKYDNYKNVVEKTLPDGLKKESVRYWAMFTQMAQTFINDPKVTDKRSVLNCLFNAPKLGLNPDPIFGHIYFIPYAGKLTYQLGYKGMIALARRSGKVTNVRSGLVFEKDQWDYFEDEKGQHFIHRPDYKLEEKQRGKEICAYSIFDDENGIPHIHVMESYHIDKIKKLVLARTKNGPWSDPLFEPEMRKKTAIRRHWKTEPVSYEIAQEIEIEEAQERGEFIQKKHEELAEVFDAPVSESQNDMPDPNSPEGKALSAELDLQAAQSEKALPFK